MRIQSLDWEDPLEKEMATHSSILAWKIPWTEEPGGLQSKESDTTEATQHTRAKVMFTGCIQKDIRKARHAHAIINRFASITEEEYREYSHLETQGIGKSTTLYFKEQEMKLKKLLGNKGPLKLSTAAKIRLRVWPPHLGLLASHVERKRSMGWKSKEISQDNKLRLGKNFSVSGIMKLTGCKQIRKVFPFLRDCIAKEIMSLY